MRNEITQYDYYYNCYSLSIIDVYIEGYALKKHLNNILFIFKGLSNEYTQ